jgi:multicomponent Na+:H+ antiporter subunit D
MIEWLHPGLILIFGAFLIPLFKGKWKKAYLLIPPAVALTVVILMIYSNVFVAGSSGSFWHVPFMQYTLILGRVDKLSLCFGLIFSLAGFSMVLYALHVESSIEHMAEFFYVGGALGVTFAGDFFTLYVFWEIMSIASLLFVWLRRTDRARRAGMRYFLWHFTGGISLLGGIIMYVIATGTIEFNYIGLVGFGGSGASFLDPYGLLGRLASYFILIGFMVNAAIPPIHGWLPDAYPEATVTGAVFMSAFTTKSAVYILIRTFPGTELLIYLGAIQTVYPILYAVLENDVRRVLGYSIINQVGFMVCGVGIGTPLAICGTVSHAFCHIIYDGLLFMSAGSVLHMTGKIRCTDLGGLWRTMPFTTMCCMVAAASISAFPGFSGFTSKTMIVSEAESLHLGIVWVLLQLASASAPGHAGVKVPYFTFFAKDSGIRVKDPPLNMCLGMGILAFFCVFLGVYPYPLYHILPYAVTYIPYTAEHVVSEAQILMFASLAFYVLVISGAYPPEQKKINLDTDWLVRIPGMRFVWFCQKPLIAFANFIDRNVLRTAGASKSSPGGVAVCEKWIDKFYHKELTSIPRAMYKGVEPLKTEIGYLPWNLLYVLLSFILLLFIMLLLGVGIK